MNNWMLCHSASVDFCIWALEDDGLRVPDFNHHADGNKRLRAAGMSAESWKGWLANTIKLYEHHQAASPDFLDSALKQPRSNDQSASPQDPWFDANLLELLDGANPTRSWRESHAVRNELAKLWPKYQHVRRKRDVVFNEFSISRRGSGEFGFGVSHVGEPLLGGNVHRIRDDLWACFESIEHAKVYTVHYPVHTYHIVDTNTIVIGTDSSDYLTPEFMHTLTQGLRRLAQLIS